ncbi:MAG: GtrA-like protein [Betaproteobacteria bacterium ADurb.Bin341]|nr:MAG: GtrA-like protein [Betaproteobacteria bacterium ADurb.Bin341]
MKPEENLNTEAQRSQSAAEKGGIFPNSEIHTEFLRFLLVGGLQTALSYGIFLLLHLFLPYAIAYSIAYGCGIIISYFLNVLFVFREKVSLASFLRFPLVYLVQYLLGLALLWLFIDRLGLAPALAMLSVIAITVPVTFLASRFLLKKSC